MTLDSQLSLPSFPHLTWNGIYAGIGGLGSFTHLPDEYRKEFLSKTSDDLIWFLARPYITGLGRTSALSQARQKVQEGVAATIDILGEAVEYPTQGGKPDKSELESRIQGSLEEIKGLTKAISQEEVLRYYGRDPRHIPTISLKPSMLGITEVDEDETIRPDFETMRQNITNILETTNDLNIRYTIDMEDYHFTDFTINACIDLVKGGFHNVGTVLQTRLDRTSNDVDRILHELGDKARIRLVIGVYTDQPDSIDDKREMKNRMLEEAKKILARGAYVEFATHDEQAILSFMDYVEENGISTDQYEVQMLLGVPNEELRHEIIMRDHLLRAYMPYATNQKQATAYMRRRLKENKEMFSHGLKHGLPLIRKSLELRKQDKERLLPTA